MLDTLEQTILSALQMIFDKFGWLGVFGLMIFENATPSVVALLLLSLVCWRRR